MNYLLAFYRNKNAGILIEVNNLEEALQESRDLTLQGFNIQRIILNNETLVTFY